MRSLNTTKVVSVLLSPMRVMHNLVSVFTICCDRAITCHAGGQADLANSNCSFGTLGLVADGKGSQQFIGTVTSSAAAAQDNVTHQCWNW